ncbi:MAG: glycosyltransferase family 4 protein [Planctomycetota bacterium]
MHKIKIVQVITRLIKGGAQKICLDIVEGLSKDQYEIHLISGPNTGTEGSLWQRANNIRNIHIKVIPQLVRNISPLCDLIALFRLYLYFSKIHPDIVHCHTSKAGFVGCVAAWLARVPIIIYLPQGHIFASGAHIPNVSGNILKLKLFYLLTRFSSLLCTKIIAVNNTDKNEQIALRLAPPYKYEVIYNAIDTKICDAPCETSINACPIRDTPATNRYPILATAGRLSSEKGQVYLLEAVKLVKNKFPDVLLLVIGDGPLRNTLETKVEQLDIKDNIRFLGMLENIIPALEKIDIFILPSLYESFGIVLLEAMAQAKPIIASNVGGIQDVVVHNQTGILVACANPEVLSMAIISLSNNKELARKMGLAGYERVNKLFRKEQMVNNFDDLYNRMVNK